MTRGAPPLTITAMVRGRIGLLGVLVLVLVLGGCGQKPGSHGGGGGGARSTAQAAVGTPVRPLPPECAGDRDHCVALARYQGVYVYRNIGPGGFCAEDGSCQWPPNRYGLRWQCVELFNRFFSTRFGIDPLPGDARDLYVNAVDVHGLEVHPNGGPRPPVAGDALVFTDDVFGHVAIVTAVTDREIRVVEQNVRGDGTNRYRYDAVTNRVLSGPSARAEAVGWIHATANFAPPAIRPQG